MSAQLADMKPVKGQKLPDVVRRETWVYGPPTVVEEMRIRGSSGSSVNFAGFLLGFWGNTKSKNLSIGEMDG